MSLYLCSDLHGQYDLYMKMLDDIRFSQDDHLYILGDIIDRGPKSIEILRDVMKRDNVTCLIGNHEMMMLDHLNRNRERGSIWTMSANGGTVTKRDFNKLSDEEKSHIVDYLNSLYLQIELEISPKIYSFSIPLGIVINMDGGCVTLLITALFLSKVYGITITWERLLSLFISVYLLSVATPAVPGGTLLVLPALLPQIGIPASGITIVIGLYFIVSRCRP
ncbi:MAG: fructose-bisphosphatase class III [Eubacteriales bacterium]|nr:fructose-bisphosphatase class III [Eubacteriales bacterium]